MIHTIQEKAQLNCFFMNSVNPKKPKPSNAVSSEPRQSAVPSIEVPAISFNELVEKTDNFGSKCLIGEGSYGRVYYAQFEGGKDFAVKKLDAPSEPESNNEFLAQVPESFLKFSSKMNMFI